MAKKATGKGSTRSGSKAKSAPRGSAVVRASADSGRGENRSSSTDGMGEAFIKLLQSPLIADLVAVAATAALAALAEHGFTSSGASRRRDRAGRAVKEAGKAAAAAVGRRLSNEMEEIRRAATESKGGGAA